MSDFDAPLTLPQLERIRQNILAGRARLSMPRDEALAHVNGLIAMARERARGAA